MGPPVKGMLLAILLAASPAGADESMDMAKVQFVQGVALFQDEDYEGALVMFQASFDLNPNYKVRYNIGLCYQALHLYVEAEEALKAYLVEGVGKIPTKRIAEVNDILLELTNVIGEIHISSNVEGALISVDGKELGETPVLDPIRVNVGQHTIRVVKEGFLEFETSVSTPGKVTMKVEVELQEEPLDKLGEAGGKLGEAGSLDKLGETGGKAGDPGGGKKVPRGVFFAGVGLTVALAAAAAVTGGLVLKKNKEFKDTYYEDEDTWRPLREDGKKLAITTDVLWGVTGGVAATTIILAIFTDFGKKEEKVSLAPVVDPTLLGLDFRLRF